MLSKMRLPRYAMVPLELCVSDIPARGLLNLSLRVADNVSKVNQLVTEVSEHHLWL
jgi:hypothetical protein